MSNLSSLLAPAPTRSNTVTAAEYVAACNAWVASLATFAAALDGVAGTLDVTNWTALGVYSTTPTPAVVIDTTDMNTYRCIGAVGPVATPPSADPTHWVLIVGVGGVVGVGGRNLITNGAMDIDQRKAGASVTPAGTTYTLDRWQAVLSVASKLTFQQVADAPAGFKNSLKVTVASQYAPLSSEVFAVTQPIEGVNCVNLALGTASAVQVAVTYWAKASVAGNYGAFLRNGAANRSYAWNQALTTSWARYTKTLTLDTAGTWLTTTGLGLEFGFNLGCGPGFRGASSAWGSGLIEITGSTEFVNQANASTLNVTGVQIEMGTAATAFERLPYNLELARCQRYYRKSFAQGTAPAQNVGANTGEFSGQSFGVGTAGIVGKVQFGAPMRAAPSVTLYNPAAANAQIRNLSDSADFSSSTTGNISDQGFRIAGTVDGGVTAGDQIIAHWAADAEL